MPQAFCVYHVWEYHDEILREKIVKYERTLSSGMELVGGGVRCIKHVSAKRAPFKL